jgi:asparagine synthase (glutamine-hydrolysing)
MLSGWAGGTIFVFRNPALTFDPTLPYGGGISLTHQAEALFDGFNQTFTWPGLTEAETWSLVRGRPWANAPRLAYESFREEFARARSWPEDYRFELFVVEQQDCRSYVESLVFHRSALHVTCPFSEWGLVDFLFSLPKEVKWSPRFRRGMFAKYMPRLARIPRDRDGVPPHPSRLVKGWATAARRVRRVARAVAPRWIPDYRTLYADYENYVRHELRPWAESLLFDKRTLDRGLFNEDAVRSLWARHLTGQELHTIGKIAPLMSIEMVMRYLVDGETAEAACGVPQRSGTRATYL